MEEDQKLDGVNNDGNADLSRQTEETSQNAGVEERRLAQEEKWKDAKTDGRAHFSDRELARLRANRFRKTIELFHVVRVLSSGLHQPESILHKLNIDALAHILDIMIPSLGPLVFLFQKDETESFVQAKHAKQATGSRILCEDPHEPFRICIRKRPLMPFEFSGQHFAGVSVRQPDIVFVHKGTLARSGRRLTMRHSRFTSHRAWGSLASNEDVYNDEIRSIVQRALQGCSGTLLMYGQTGTGKTYTMMGALKELEKDLVGKAIRVEFFELAQKKAYDLLSERRFAGWFRIVFVVELSYLFMRQLKLLQGADGKVHVRGAKQLLLECTAEHGLQEVLRDGLALRSVEVTGRLSIAFTSCGFGNWFSLVVRAKSHQLAISCCIAHQLARCTGANRSKDNLGGSCWK